MGIINSLWLFFLAVLEIIFYAFFRILFYGIPSAIVLTPFYYLTRFAIFRLEDTPSLRSPKNPLLYLGFIGAMILASLAVFLAYLVGGSGRWLACVLGLPATSESGIIPWAWGWAVYVVGFLVGLGICIAVLQVPNFVKSGFKDFENVGSDTDWVTARLFIFLPGLLSYVLTFFWPDVLGRVFPMKTMAHQQISDLVWSGDKLPGSFDLWPIPSR